MTSSLKFAPGLNLPFDVLTEAIGIVANRGAGKTYTSKKLVELMTEVGLPTCVIDPLGVWYGLRSSADGKKPGLPFIVFGGKHADVPLNPTQGQESAPGRAIAQWLLGHPVPVILDLSQMRKAAQRRFVAGFLDEMYEGNEHPLHVVVDECDLFCPQRPPKDFPVSLLGTMEDVVRRGRSKGLGITLISQRPAVIHKDVLSQISVLIVLRLVGPQDRRAIKEWIEDQGSEHDRRRVMESLSSLQVGQGWLYSPAFLGVLQQFKAYPAKTFDSSATPKVGEKRIEPTSFASVDLTVLNEELEQTVEQAKLSDPKHLKAVVAQLRGSVAALQELVGRQDEELAQLRQRPPETIEAIPAALFESLHSIRCMIEGGLDAVQQGASSLADLVSEGDRQHKIEKIARVGADFPPPVKIPEGPAGKVTVSVSSRPPLNDSPLGKVEREILTVLAQYAAGRTLEQIAILTSRSSKSGGFKNGLSALRTAGLLIGRNNEVMNITVAGREALGPVEPLPVGVDLMEMWRSKLGKAERAALEGIVAQWPGSIDLTSLAPIAGYSPNSGGYKNALSRLRTLGLIEGPNSDMKASDMLFENGDWR